MTARRDLSLDLLLDLDGSTFIAVGEYWVKFVVKSVPPSVERPHGISYSLTLHNGNGARLVGFDNAHVVSTGRDHQYRGVLDHKHRMHTTKRYAYRDAATLLADFWAEVDAVLKELGGPSS